MNVVRYSDYADSVRYALTTRPRQGGDVEIVLDLFKGSTPVSQTVLARVAPREAHAVLMRCRGHLERQGHHAVVNVPPPKLEVDVEAPDPRLTLSVAAFDWMFEAS